MSIKYFNWISISLIVVSLILLSPAGYYFLTHQVYSATAFDKSFDEKMLSVITILITGLMAISIFIQILSSNKQLSTILPKVKIVDSTIEYEIKRLSDKDSRIISMDVHLNLLNETSTPIYIRSYEINIGKWDSRCGEGFHLKERGKPSLPTEIRDTIKWCPYLLIPPQQAEAITLVVDYSGNPLGSSYIIGYIEKANKKKLRDIQKAEIVLTGNFGIEKSTPYFFPKRT